MVVSMSLLMETIDAKDRKDVVSQFKFLKIMDYYPMCTVESESLHEETWKLLDEYEYEQMLEKEAKEKEKQKKALTADKFSKLVNKLNTCNKRIDNALSRCDKATQTMLKQDSPTKLHSLRVEKANIDYAIAMELLNETAQQVADILEMTVDQVAYCDDLEQAWDDKYGKAVEKGE